MSASGDTESVPVEAESEPAAHEAEAEASTAAPAAVAAHGALVGGGADALEASTACIEPELEPEPEPKAKAEPAAGTQAPAACAPAEAAADVHAPGPGNVARLSDAELADVVSRRVARAQSGFGKRRARVVRELMAANRAGIRAQLDALESAFTGRRVVDASALDAEETEAAPLCHERRGKRKMPSAPPLPPYTAYVPLRTNFPVVESEAGDPGEPIYIPYVGDSEADVQSAMKLLHSIAEIRGHVAGKRGGTSAARGGGDKGSGAAVIAEASAAGSRQQRRSAPRGADSALFRLGDIGVLSAEEQEAATRRLRRRPRDVEVVAAVTRELGCSERVVGALAAAVGDTAHAVRERLPARWRERGDDGEQPPSPSRAPSRHHQDREHGGLDAPDEEHGAEEVKRGSVASALSSDSMYTLFCRRCFCFDCGLHGVLHPQPHERVPDATLRDGTGHGGDGHREACGPDCFVTACRGTAGNDHAALTARLTALVEERAAAARDAPWNRDELRALQIGRELFAGDFCRIAAACVASRSCRECACQAYEHEGDALVRALCTPARTPAVAQGKRQPAYTRRRSRARALSSRVYRLPATAAASSSLDGGVIRSAAAEQQMEEFTPCVHEGACRPGACACVDAGYPCEKYCRCYCPGATAPCAYLFAGCDCCKAMCNTRKCPCFAASRECDPDLCTSCGASHRPGVERRCANVALQAGRQQRLLIGRSDVHGWGVFARDDIPKDAFVAEYGGEVVSQAEAELRGRMCDHNNLSFLFNLGASLCIDAQRKGTRAKFINHGRHAPYRNCRVSYRIVNTDARVAVYADRNIRAGEELFFDYGHGEGKSAPRWVRHSDKREQRRRLQVDGRTRAS